MDPRHEAEFRRLFEIEAAEQLGRLAETVLELEGAGGRVDLVATLFRDAHTMKSSAALVGLPLVADVAHRLEDLLGELRAGTRTVTPGLVDGVLQVVDALRALIAAGLAGAPGDEHADAAAAGLARARDEAPAAAGAPAAPDASGPPPAPAALPGPAAAATPVSEALAPAIVRPPALRPADAAAAPAAPLPSIVRPPALRPRAAPAGPAEPAAPGPERADEPSLPPAAGPPTPAEAPADPASPATEPAAAPAEAGRLVPVGLDRLDGLVRLSGEAVAAQLRLTHLLRAHITGDPDAEAAELELRRALAGVQAQTMRTRMTTLEGIAGNLRRAVRDVARGAGKEVDYRLEGERVELDRAVLDGLRDPLLHLVRNAVDHGLESPGDREAAGKSRTGTVRVTAVRRGPEIVVTVADDGRGLDLDALRAAAGAPDLSAREAAALVFRPGLSTAGAVTDVSGRGVGLDAVRTAVEALRGHVDVQSTPGRGCRFTVAVPLTLAIVPCVMVEAGSQRYHVPTHATVGIADDLPGAEIGLEGGSALWVGGDIVPLGDLPTVLGGTPCRVGGRALVLEGASGMRHAFRVDAVLEQRNVTVKELGGVVPRSQLVAGASIEADGTVVLVLDASALVEAGDGAPREASGPAGPVTGAGEAPAGSARILVVDDALTVRELERSILERAGYAVRVAVDGEEALAALAAERPDLVITDVEMPRLDGFGLAAAIRARPALASLPVLMVTSRADPEDRRRGLDAGADAYLAKQDFDGPKLLEAVGRLLGS